MWLGFLQSRLRSWPIFKHHEIKSSLDYLFCEERQVCTERRFKAHVRQGFLLVCTLLYSCGINLHMWPLSFSRSNFFFFSVFTTMKTAGEGKEVCLRLLGSGTSFCSRTSLRSHLSLFLSNPLGRYTCFFLVNCEGGDWNKVEWDRVYASSSPQKIQIQLHSLHLHIPNITAFWILIAFIASFF